MTTQQKDKFTPELRILAASLLSMAVILVWAKFFAPKPVPPAQATKPGFTASAPTAADGGKPDSHMTAVPASKAAAGSMAQQQMMMKIMPITMAGIFMISPISSGLAVYILTSSVVGIGHQWYLNRKHPAPAPVKITRGKKS